VSYWVTAYLGLGSNLPGRYNPQTNLCLACWELTEIDGIRVRQVSSVYRSAPWGEQEQPPFLNAVVEIETVLSPEELLRNLKKVELAIGRVPTYRWGPRVIDIDILLYAQQEIKSSDLQIPHRYLLQRAFAYVPLLEIAPEVRLPDGREIRQVVAYPGELGESLVKIGKLFR